MSQNSRDEFKLPAWADSLQTLQADAEGLDSGRITIHFPDQSDPLALDRREFLRVAAAAAAATGLTAAAGCNVPQDKIVPYVDRPEEVYHGVPNTYTTVCRGCSAGCGALLTVREGRVTKLEGNPDHLLSLGGLCARGQAAPLDVYSPDRLRAPMQIARLGDASKLTREDLDKKNVTWEALDAAVVTALKAAKGGKVRLLTSPMTGPAQKALIAAFLGGFGDASLTTWEPLAPSATLDAHKTAYGDAFAPNYRFEAAGAIVSFGAEFLDSLQGSVHYTRAFASRRDPDLGAGMSRFIAFEGRRTLTGSAADLRHRVRTSDLLYVALAVAAELVASGVNSPLASDPTVKATLGGYSADKTGAAVGLPPQAIKDAAAALAAAGPKGLAVAARAGAGPEGSALETVVALINELLGAVGTTVDHARTLESGSSWSDVARLTAELAAGQIDVLIVAGLNPVYDAPPSLKFAEAMGKAKTVIAVDTLLTETAVRADWIASASHWLESWGDSENVAGIYSLQQPGMTPLHQTRSLEESLLTWGKALGVATFDAAIQASAAYKDPERRPSPGPWHFFLKAHWSGEIHKTLGSPVGGLAFFEAVARKGAFTARSGGRKPSTFAASALKNISGARPDKPSGSVEVDLWANNTVYDGRGASNPFLMEQPDALTHTSWGNCACLSPKRFTDLGLTRLGDVVEISTEAGALSLPVMIIPGMHDDVVAIQLGYGRTHAGVVGSGVGLNAFALAGAGAEGPRYHGLGGKLKATGAFEELGMARGVVHVLDHNRHIVPHTSLEEYAKDKTSGAHMEGGEQFWGDHKYPDLKWGMTIDLSRCTGCAACAVACSVENNIPVVGKQGLLEGRLMHWLRIDRYFALPKVEGKADYVQEMLKVSPMIAAADYLENPEMLLEPMLCQHCDNAPCETVCPVAATVHSDDGLNEQVYNRCVGTRYCANNCPYKVRRFNWYNYNKDRSEEFISQVFPEVIELANLNARWPQALHFNPEVTVRSRGVMEKCTFCVQRLRKSTKVSKKLGINGPPPKTACQQTCPAGAIDFGNIADEKAPVTAKFNAERAYTVLSAVGTKPAVRYLTRVRNTGPAKA